MCKESLTQHRDPVAGMFSIEVFFMELPFRSLTHPELPTREPIFCQKLMN